MENSKARRSLGKSQQKQIVSKYFYKLYEELSNG